MYRSPYNNGLGTYPDRYSDKSRRSTSTSPSSFERGNDYFFFKKEQSIQGELKWSD